MKMIKKEIDFACIKRWLRGSNKEILIACYFLDKDEYLENEIKENDQTGFLV